MSKSKTKVTLKLIGLLVIAISCVLFINLKHIKNSNHLTPAGSTHSQKIITDWKSPH